MMNINGICMSIFTKENCIEYNTENTIKLLELFKEKEVIPSFIPEIGQNTKPIYRPLIKSNTDGILLIIGSSRIDIRNDYFDKVIYCQYTKEELLKFFGKFKFYFERLKSTFEDLRINRIAINLSILCDINDIKLSSKINCINLYNIDDDKVISDLTQIKVIDLINFKKSKVNAIFSLNVRDKINIIFDINTLHNLDSKFENDEVDCFFNKSIELINDSVIELKE